MATLEEMINAPIVVDLKGRSGTAVDRSQAQNEYKPEVRGSSSFDTWGRGDPSVAEQHPKIAEDPQAAYLRKAEMLIDRTGKALVNNLEKDLNRYDELAKAGNEKGTKLKQKEILESIESSLGRGEHYHGQMFNEGMELLGNDPILYQRLKSCYENYHNHDERAPSFETWIERLEIKTSKQKADYVFENSFFNYSEVSKDLILSPLQKADKTTASKEFVFNLFEHGKFLDRDGITTLIAEAEKAGFDKNKLPTPLRKAFDAYSTNEVSAELYAKTLQGVLSENISKDDFSKAVTAIFKKLSLEQQYEVLFAYNKLEGKADLNKAETALQRFNERAGELKIPKEDSDKLAELLSNPVKVNFRAFHSLLTEQGSSGKALALVLLAESTDPDGVLDGVSKEILGKNSSRADYIKLFDKDGMLSNCLVSSNSPIRYRVSMIEWAMQNDSPELFKAVLGSIPPTLNKDFENSHLELMLKKDLGDPVLPDKPGYANYMAERDKHIRYYKTKDGDPPEVGEFINYNKVLEHRGFSKEQIEVFTGK